MLTNVKLIEEPMPKEKPPSAQIAKLQIPHHFNKPGISGAAERWAI